jgi:1-phosphofructokinase family hexose kinase
VILSAGLTPAWQQILVFDRFHLGEVNRAAEAHWMASGKVVNAAIAAHRLGGPSLALAPVGGPPAAEIDRQFEELGCAHRWVVTQSATRVCTTILDRATHRITELVENGRLLTAAELDEFRRAYAEEVAKAHVAVIIGSLPAGVPLSLYRELVQCTPCPAVLDFRGQGLLETLDLRPLVVKPNREELSATLGRGLTSDDELREAVQSLARRGAQWVVTTQGPGAVWLSTASRVWRLRPPEAEEIVNPIGCGDVLAATIAWAVGQGREMIDAVRLGIAAAGENLRQLFPGRIDPSRVDQRAALVEVEEL